MDLSLQIVPVGDTTPREIAAASQELQELLERLPGMARLEPLRIPAPEGSKGPFVAALGSFALSVAPKVIQGMLEVVRTVLARQPGLTEFVVETKDRKFRFKFDPRKVTPKELGDLSERLLAIQPPS